MQTQLQNDKEINDDSEDEQEIVIKEEGQNLFSRVKLINYLTKIAIFKN